MIEEIIESRRSIRKFKTDPIPQESLERIMQSAIWAPSAMNRQNWKFFVLTDEMRDRMALLHRQIFEEIKEGLKERYGEEGVELRRNIYANFSGAPVAIACFTEIQDKENPRGDIISAALACENLILQAHSMGIGALTMTSSLRISDEISFLCGVDTDKMDLVMVILLGYANDKPEPPARRKKRVIYASQPGDIKH
ncbi:MAG: nitroreductase family protein [bacterium]|nr:nitroreductase family protein [bacterium]